MAETNQVTKSLALAEDLSRGVGTEDQNRAGTPVTGHKVYVPIAVENTTVMANLHPEFTTFAAVVAAGKTNYYVYTDSVVAGGIPSNVTGGTWVLQTSDNFLGGLDDIKIPVQRSWSNTVGRNQHDINNERGPSVLDWGAVPSNGITNDPSQDQDNTVAVQNAIYATGWNGYVYLPSFGTGEPSRYKITSVSNPYGVRFYGPGALYTPSTGNGARQLNYGGDILNLHCGQEYLHRAYSQMQAGGLLGIKMFGDSTVSGRNGESADYYPEVVLARAFADAGYSSLALANLGVSGSNITQMNAVGQLNSQTHLLIIKYGINDGGTGQTERLRIFAEALNAKLAEIRAAAFGNLTSLSIILMMPNTTNDGNLFGRNGYWYEQLRHVYLQAARTYQCAVYDTYNDMPNSLGLAGTAMDNPFNDGRAIHPLNTMMTWIYGGLVNRFFNGLMLNKARTNAFHNYNSAAATVSASVSPANYDRGQNWYRALTTQGWPEDGFVKVDKSGDDIVSQTLIPFDSRSRIKIRQGSPGSNTWSIFTGIKTALTLANGWTGNLYYIVDTDGRVNLVGNISGGTVTAGTTIATGLPAGHFPNDDRRYAIMTQAGAFATVGINTSGNIYIPNGGGGFSATGMYINTFYYCI